VRGAAHAEERKTPLIDETDQAYADGFKAGFATGKRECARFLRRLKDVASCKDCCKGCLTLVKQTIAAASKKKVR
jgi:hypothetical protein